MVLAHLAFTGGRVSISLYAIRQHASTLTVGLLVSLLSIVPMALSVHLGRWTDRIGANRPTLIGLVAVVAGTLMPALQESIAMLCAASVVMGTGFMLIHIAINNATGHESTPENRTQAFTVLAVGFSISSILGPVIAGFTIDHAGFTAVFLVLALFPAAALLYLLLTASSAPAHVAHLQPPEGTHVMDLLRNAPLRADFIVSGLMSMSWDMYTFMVPVQGARIGLSASSIGTIMGTFGVATFVVRLCTPWISRRFDQWQTLTAALVTTVVVYALFPLFTALPVLLALAFVLGLGLGSAQPMVLSLIHHTAPTGRVGEAIGVRTSFMNLSQVFMPILFGSLGAAFGMVPAFWTLALVLSGGSFYAGKRRVEIKTLHKM